MKSKIEYWTVEDIYKNRDNIEFPPYQREPHLWNLEEKSKLMDSIINDIPIPPIFLFKKEDGNYECVDGNQRLHTIYSFFLNEFKIDDEGDYDTIKTKNPPLLDKIKRFKIPIAILEDIDDIGLRELFRRLQLGRLLNPGEKLNSLIGDMKDVIFNELQKYEFILNLGIQNNRFARSELLAQICINSFSISESGQYESARYFKLLRFFENHSKFTDTDKKNMEIVKNTLRKLNDLFGKNAKEIRTKAYVLSAYIFIENMVRNNYMSDAKLFAEFYLRFLEILRTQARKGLDYDQQFREILDFYKYSSTAAFEPYSIQRRNRLLQEFFEEYKKTKKIRGES